MSDFPVEEQNPPAGAERLGNESKVSTFSECVRGADVPYGAASRVFQPNNENTPSGELNRPLDQCGGYAVPGVDKSVVARPVDHNALQGTNKGDHRQDAGHVVMPPNPAPRQAVGQFPNNSKTDGSGAFSKPSGFASFPPDNNNAAA